MQIDYGTHAELWGAVATVSSTVAASIYGLGYKFGKLQQVVEQAMQNQQAIADHLGLALPYPQLAKGK